MRKIILSIAITCFAGAIALAQQAVPVGKGSYAEYTPLTKSRSDEHGGDQSRIMETRKLYITEKNNGLPVPTNDWWTDLIVTPYSGNLWAYPQVVKAESYGIYVAYPNEWEETGREMKWKTQLEITGKRFAPASADANNWHDWGLDFLMKDNEKEMLVTLAHGVPFTWVETKNIELQLRVKEADYYSETGKITLPYTGSQIVIQMANDAYGIYVPEGTVFSEKNGQVEIAFSGNKQYLSVGLLPSREDLTAYAKYAYTVPRKTTVSWNYNETTGKIRTQWDLETENLKGENQLNVLQGFIPHHYKKSGHSFSFLPYEYATPRGKMKMSEGKSFVIDYDFSGMLPYYPAPKENSSLNNPYMPSRMKQMISEYADKGGFGADTYWGGKGLIQMGMYMTFAYETGETELFEKCRKRLKSALVDWLTYTPGENNFFFARYNRWGAMVGYDTSYDSDTFNDHHFHYGYFTYASSLLSLFDEDFKNNYGEMITLIAKDYANWDKSDNRFPFFRTLDPWAGHSYAGGLGGWNGNGQESTSEAMQGWGGLYLLGMATGNKSMRDAGIFGWTLESRGVAEYWFDRDKENIRYDKYDKPYNSNLTSQGIGWWTWFSGDPVWMHSIQWMPISPCQNHLYQDLTFARWDYDQMMQSKEMKGFYEEPVVDGPGSLGYDSGIGNVVLSYLQISSPDETAEIFDYLWNNNKPTAKNIDTGGITYFLTHSHRTYGDICFDIHADIPTATVYKHKQTEKMTFVAYNPESTEKTIIFYQNGSQIKQFKAPAKRLTVYSEEPVLSKVNILIPASMTVEPGQTLQLEARLSDQYDVEISGNVSWTVDTNGTVSPSGLFTAGTTKGTIARVTVRSGELTDIIDLKINDKPVLTTARITPQLSFLEVGKTIEYQIEMSDQYGDKYQAGVDWKILKNNQLIKQDALFDIQTIGKYKVQASVEGKEYETEVYLTPPFNNLAFNKPAQSSSEENVGTLTRYATDGDRTTRWGSQHDDLQWIYVDLQEVSYIAYVTIYWEAAYSSLFDIQVSDDGQEWETIQTVTGTGGISTLEINTEARYIKMNGRERATVYGHSLYEFEVYGVAPAGSEPVLFGIDIQPRYAVLKEGESIQLSTSGYDQFGNMMDVNPQFNLLSGTGNITESGILTPSRYGTITVEARVNNQTSKASFIVEESPKPKSISIFPEKTLLVKGEKLFFSVIGKDQFGVLIPINDVSYTLVGNDGSELTGSVFSGNAAGSYEIIATSGSSKDTAYVQVAELSEINLAFQKPVTTSSYENAGTIPGHVNDGDMTSRWGSGFADGEYIQIDLLKSYMLNKMKICWEAAYATGYLIETSVDEDVWKTVYEEKSGTGGNKEISFDPLEGRYVKITCLKRKTQYGSSIYEWEVYASAFTQTNLNESSSSISDARIDRGILYVSGENLDEISVFEITGRLISTIQLNGNDHYQGFFPGKKGVFIIAVKNRNEVKTYKLLH